jgi:excisionase family DNA binding protein
MINNIMTVREVAQFLRLTKKAAYRYALEGVISGFKVGVVWRFRHDEIEKLTKGRSAESIKRAG